MVTLLLQGSYWEIDPSPLEDSSETLSSSGFPRKRKTSDKVSDVILHHDTVWVVDVVLVHGVIDCWCSGSSLWVNLMQRIVISF